MSLAEDYAALRNGAGGRAVARDVLRLSGADAESYLQGQCSQDVAALAPGASADALLLSPQGKLEAYIRVTRTAPDVFVLDTEGGRGGEVRQRLERFRLRVKVDFEDLDYRFISIRGPLSPPAGSLPAGVDLALPFVWGAVSGVDLLGPAAALPPGVHPCGAAAWEALRVEAGIPAMGSELDERTIAAEAGLVERCVSFTKGCYTGQELVARIDARGSKVARHLRGIVLGGQAPEGEPGPPVPAGSEIVAPGRDKVAGTVTSSAWSPRLGAVALGYVHRDVTAPAAVQLRLPGGEIRSAEVRALPLAG